MLISLLTILGFSGCHDIIDDKPTLIDTSWYTAYPSATKFTISRADELAGLAQLVNKESVSFSGNTITLMANLDLSDYSEGEGWTPIGNSYNSFNGTFEGNNKSISGLFINSKNNKIGLFGSVEYAEIMNLSIKNAIVTGKETTGILIGRATDTKINCCNVTGTVNGFKTMGGMAGEIFNSIITNCYAAGTMSCSDIVGGLAGSIIESTVANCYTTGIVNGSAFRAGGIAGDASDSIMTNCYAIGALNGDSYVGSLVGSCDMNVAITNCYATSMITGRARVGGLVGGIEKDTKVKNNLALNPSINRVKDTEEDSFGYVAGNSEPGNVLDTNYVLDGMKLPKPIGLTLEGDPGHEPKINKAYATSRVVYEDDLGWDFGNDDEHPWKWGGTDYPLPVLYWQMPESYPDLAKHLK